MRRDLRGNPVRFKRVGYGYRRKTTAPYAILPGETFVRLSTNVGSWQVLSACLGRWKRAIVRDLALYALCTGADALRISLLQAGNSFAHFPVANCNILQCTRHPIGNRTGYPHSPRGKPSRLNSPHRPGRQGVHHTGLPDTIGALDNRNQLACGWKPAPLSGLPIRTSR